jgi:hypothetical protein
MSLQIIIVFVTYVLDRFSATLQLFSGPDVDGSMLLE